MSLRLGTQVDAHPAMSALTAGSDLICFAHLRWHFVWQRPQHLLTRAARDRHVSFVEEPRDTDGPARLEITPVTERLSVVVPLLPHGMSADQASHAQRQLLADWWRERRFNSPLLWYDTPMAIAFTRSLAAGVVVYDCMEELSMFKGAPPALPGLEAELLERASEVCCSRPWTARWNSGCGRRDIARWIGTRVRERSKLRPSLSQSCSAA